MRNVALALIVRFTVLAVKRAWDDLPGGYVWHVRWPLLALKVVGLVAGSIILTYVHTWMPRTARVALWCAIALLLLDDAWDVVQLARLAGWLP